MCGSDFEALLKAIVWTARVAEGDTGAPESPTDTSLDVFVGVKQPFWIGGQAALPRSKEYDETQNG
jgi:hypothetical protein